jgi:hypothetical protein
MTTVILILLLPLLIYAGATYFIEKISTLQWVEAGPVDSVCWHNRSKVKMLTNRDIVRADNGNVKNISEYRQFAVSGTCMEKRGIKSGGIVFVEMFENTDNAKKWELIKKDDILLIYLDDERYKGYKIRGFDGTDGNNSDRLMTFYYQGDRKYESSQSHSISQIVGKVKFAVTPEELE